ncbi:Activator of stress protein 1 [Colletotrichum sp. SAR11_59]|nr:Activator of stress protein 1 [Colletotrichum sp. SAR11_59]
MDEFRRPLPGPASPAAADAAHRASSAAAASVSSPRGGGSIGESRKRSFSSADHQSPLSDEQQQLSGPGAAANRRKSQKVSRACDFCKQRKAKCSGTIPCDKCTRKGLTCVYDAKYSRGRPPTPPPSAVWSASSSTSHPGGPASGSEEPPVMLQTTETAGRTISAPVTASSLRGQVRESQGPASRASPELGMAEIQGQVFDPTSGVTFLHRAWKRLSKQDSSIVPDYLNASTENQPLMLAGDKPLPPITDDDVANFSLPSSRELQDLLGMYFDVCIATYRVLHRPTVEVWLKTMVDNLAQGKPVWQDIGRGKASIVLTALAVATAHSEKSKGFHEPEDERLSLARSDRLFSYVLDKYLGVIFGRPRHFHDDDIDQDYPDRIDDEDMTAQGPIERFEEHSDCHIDALICHVKIAQIIGNTSREVYSIKAISEQGRVAAAHRFSEKIHEWRASLPPHLGNLSSGSETQILECLGAARTVLETVDGMAAEGPIFHAFWWTQYVTFCALLVTYVWDIQQKRRGILLESEGKIKHAKLMDLAECCQTHLAHATASNSPSRRYAIILEEFRTEGLGQMSRKNNGQPPLASQAAAPRLAVPAADTQTQLPQPQGNGATTMGGFDFNSAYAAGSGTVDLMDQGDPGLLGSNLLDEWQTTDWLDLDSSAFGPYLDIDANPYAWMPDIGG